MLNKAPTLSFRLTKIIVFMTFGLCVLFSMVTFFIAYSLEDAMFNQQLIQANAQFQQAQYLPLTIEKKPNLSEFGLTLAPSSQYMEFDPNDIFGEFSFQDKHYHYLKLSDGLLLMDVTEQVVVKSGMKDILIMLLLIIIPCLLFSVVVAKKMSNYALKPFHQLTRHFQYKALHQDDDHTSPMNIEETDIKAIAEQLEQAMQAQKSVLDDQIIFNQGMSHDIRTPLQVMSSSMELIEVNYPDLYQQPSVQRLNKALRRIKRTSNALLWLTSNEQYNEICCVQTILKSVLKESISLTKAHHINISVNKVNHSLMMSLPEDVIELIFFNLINNAIHHGQPQHDMIELVIHISANGVTFTNKYNGDIDKSQPHFSLGLKLIGKLSKRFDIGFSTSIENSIYSASLYHIKNDIG